MKKGHILTYNVEPVLQTTSTKRPPLHNVHTHKSTQVKFGRIYTV